MKMIGSNLFDTLIGTKFADTIHAGGSNDLLASNGGRDSIYGEGGRDLISGFAFNLNKISASEYRSAYVNGGAEYDTLILDIDPAKSVSQHERASRAMTIVNVEEIIYNVGATNSRQVIIGSGKLETICASGDATLRGMGGNDYIFSVGGEDNLSGGDGNDFLSAGLGHNALSGGNGSDTFFFKLEPGGGYQYSNVEDFQRKNDKIAILIDVEQTNLIYRQTGEARHPNTGYGDGLQTVGGTIGDYVSENNGRFFDRNDFRSNSNFFQDFVTYEQSTGSVLIKNYRQIDEDTLFRNDVLVAHIEGNKNLTSDDFAFLIG